MNKCFSTTERKCGSARIYFYSTSSNVRLNAHIFRARSIHFSLASTQTFSFIERESKGESLLNLLLFSYFNIITLFQHGEGRTFLFQSYIICWLIGPIANWPEVLKDGVYIVKKRCTRHPMWGGGLESETTWSNQQHPSVHS